LKAQTSRLDVMASWHQPADHNLTRRIGGRIPVIDVDLYRSDDALGIGVYGRHGDGRRAILR
jgi:hypothetical protein